MDRPSFAVFQATRPRLDCQPPEGHADSAARVHRRGRWHGGFDGAAKGVEANKPADISQCPEGMPTGQREPRGYVYGVNPHGRRVNAAPSQRFRGRVGAEPRSLATPVSCNGRHSSPPRPCVGPASPHPISAQRLGRPVQRWTGTPMRLRRFVESVSLFRAAR